MLFARFAFSDNQQIIDFLLICPLFSQWNIFNCLQRWTSLVISGRGERSAGKSLAAHVILWHPPGQPLASKRQSPFHQRSLHGLSPSLFYSCLLPFYFCFSSSISHFHSNFITPLALWARLSFPWLTVVVVPDTSIHLPLCALMNVDSSEEYKILCLCVTTTGECVC